MVQFLARNWLWIAFLVVFLTMHRRGYGCGMHGSHQHGQSHRDHDETGLTK